EVCDEFWLVVDGGVEELDADLDDYQRWLLEVARARARGGEAPARPGRSPSVVAAPNARAPAPKASPPAGNRRDERKQQAQSRAQLATRTRPLRLEITQIDGRLERLGAEKAELEAALLAGAVPSTDMAEHGRRLNHIAAETAMLEERWLELHAQIESITVGG
ncbi:MAG TPA: ABC transporter, partial [Burkholderiaceae bacterium]|nr:ABC transporter [Burkholderiaceae bacterium]